MPGYVFKDVEGEVRKLWASHQIYEKAKAGHRPDAPKFYYLDGPPYTSGKVHLGTTWGKTLRDMVMRYKRMQGFRVWDRAGYDMHGLPTEHATEKKLGIHGREQIREYGVEKFIEECRILCIENMKKMSEDFKSLGVWMDFDNAYQSISKEFMDGEWWFVKVAHEKGRLYEGERTMTWDASNATALAKHELEYKNITDTAIYVKFPVKEDTYLIIWTTTPWTIPFNLAIMVNPELTYAKVKVVWQGKAEHWYIAKDLLDSFIKDQLHEEYVIEEEIAGKELEGTSYTHPFNNPIYAELKAKMPKVHTVILSSEYVDTSAGTGLVHCAPGCGPEDYEVGHRNGIKPFNTLDEQGVCRNLEPFNGLLAKTDDDEFIRLIDEQGALVHQHKYTHEYPHGERSHEPVIFRTTKQWFLKVEDMKDRLIAENNKITWVPDAAYNAFNSWLENLRDNSISKQRYWGTPIPIWRNTKDPSDYIVVGSAKELAELAQLEHEPEDLHMPTVDKIVIKKHGKDGKVHEYKRIPDVLDVWVDAGTVSWNCLSYPKRHDLLEDWFPADFILEGKDQIRGWFNLLHIASMIAFDKPAFKAVYMHGFINDSQGRKMSKSLNNYIVPEEVVGKYGVDATRYYMIGAANPGFDMNYNFDDVDAKFKNLLVYWNLHNYTLELLQTNDISPTPVAELSLSVEEKYLLSRLASTVKQMTGKLDTYQLNEVPTCVETFLLDMSRTYIQLVRDKATAGTDEEKQVVASILFHCMLEAITLLAPITPFVAEKMYQEFKRSFPALCKETSIHLRHWPSVQEDHIDERLEEEFIIAKDLITAILAARDKAQLGVRWPVQEVRVDCTPAQADALRHMLSLITTQTNIKQLSFEPIEIQYSVEANTKTVGKQFGKETQAVMTLIKDHQHELAAMLKEKKDHLVIDNKTIKEEHLDITRHVPDKYQVGEGNILRAYLDTVRTPELEREGYAREIIRRIQQLRKNANLVKADRIHVEIAAPDAMLHAAIQEHSTTIAERTGTAKLQLVATVSQHLEHVSAEKLKGTAFIIGFTKN
jgi:isoleucyl-tRNA synthetase